ncbi:MAG: XisI protein [Oscillatoriales cyanobacterium]|nr:MAG: XisI protein [Oscillatoriales cyanobacterium]
MEALNVDTERLQAYRTAIKHLLTDYAAYTPSYGDIEIQTLFDGEHDHYQVLAIGWHNKQRIYGCSIHLDLKQGKVWIQANNTELDIAQALVEQGIPKDDIVIGFQPPYLRRFSGYAIS